VDLRFTKYRLCTCIPLCSYNRDRDNTVEENSSVFSLMRSAGCPQQEHAGSKTLHQQNSQVLDWRCQLTCIMAIKRRWWLLYVATIVHLHCSLHSDIAGTECFVLVIDHHISLANCNALNGLPAKSKKTRGKLGTGFYRPDALPIWTVTICPLCWQSNSVKAMSFVHIILHTVNVKWLTIREITRIVCTVMSVFFGETVYYGYN